MSSERELLAQAEKVIRLTGHEMSCQFRGCTCGAVENLKIERSEYYRMKNALTSNHEVKPEKGLNG